MCAPCQQVVISSLDVSVTQQARDLIRLAQRMGPLAGIFHLAMVLNDRLFPNMVGSPGPAHPPATWHITVPSLVSSHVQGAVQVLLLVRPLSVHRKWSPHDASCL